jgi:hypothetical protein
MRIKYLDPCLTSLMLAVSGAELLRDGRVAYLLSVP